MKDSETALSAQDYSNEITTPAPEKDILSYYPTRQLYWLNGTNQPPFCNKPDQPLNKTMLMNAMRKSESHCKLFDMSVEVDMALYQLIKNRVLRGWYRIAKEETHWDADGKKMLIWVDWVQDYLFCTYTDEYIINDYVK